MPAILKAYDLWYTPAVAAELKDSFPSGQEFWRLATAGIVREIAPQTQQFREYGPGEQAPINVALEHRDWLLFLDDQRPLQAAAGSGLQVLCTPVLTVAFYVEGTLSAEQSLRVLARLAAIQTVSPTLLAVAVAQRGKAFEVREGH
ncbi:MAG: hypothetical protein ACR2PL_17300 [Dehalococcoidia bacterium]